MNNKKANVIGAGLAGCEAALQLANHGITVDLYEMKPGKYTPAHTSESFAELVCSNSLKADRPDSASGMLKQEMAALGSIVMQSAKRCRVPAGGALAVDRDAFSTYITQAILSHPNIHVIHQEVTAIPQGNTILATGPLTSDPLSQAISQLTGQDALHFYDAAAPIVAFDSIDMNIAFFQGRYHQAADYINCPMNQQEYQAFYDALISAETAVLHGFDKPHFEMCMPIEALAKRGFQTPLFGPMSPKGIDDPKTGRWPFALVQLRKEDAQGSMYNLVGFQTNLKFSEQQRVFRMIPGLKNAQFYRYGVMHRNMYIQGNVLLDDQMRLKKRPSVRFAGQITGVEGYMESAASGLYTGLSLAREMLGQTEFTFPKSTALGALMGYVVDYCGKDYQPMNMNFGIIAHDVSHIRNKKERYLAIARKGKEEFLDTLKRYAITPERMEWNV